ncbi:MAG: SDR family NAD(P)-dependent oxidoreductase [Candidatus Bathyarchaeia archaeon]
MSVLKNCKVIVTGGAGFIGSHLVDRLLEMQCKVIVYDNLDEYYLGKEDNFHHNLNVENFHFVKGSILDYKTLFEYMKGSDIVFHLAAQPGVRFSVINPSKTLKVNVLGTLNVLRASEKACVKKLIFASSSSVYGKINHTYIDGKYPTKPISIYGASKLAAENLCEVFSDQLGLNIVILRYHTVYGPRQRPDMAIHKWVRQIFSNKPVTIYGDGNQTRDFTYVEDIIRATVKAAEVDKADGETFDIGAGCYSSINEVVRLLADLTGINFEVIHEHPKIADVPHTCADISKARRLLGYEPNTKIEEGLQRFISWYKTHKIRNGDNQS